MSIRFVTGVVALGVASVSLGVAPTSRPLHAEVFYFQDFESLPSGDIDGRGSRWWVDKSSPYGDAVGNVTTVSYARSGGKALGLAAAVEYGPSPYILKEVEWQDQTPSMPHGGWIELSWWMYPYYSDPNHHRWEIYVTGLSLGGPGTVARLGNEGLDPDTQLDAYIQGQWQQFFEFLPAYSWKKIVLQIDFGLTPDRYRFCVLESDRNPAPDDWHPVTDNHSEWYSLRGEPAGFDAEYFGAIGFANESDGLFPGWNLVIDDFQARVVPEPATLMLMVTGGLVLGLVPLWRRAKGAA